MAHTSYSKQHKTEKSGLDSKQVNITARVTTLGVKATNEGVSDRP